MKIGDKVIVTGRDSRKAIERYRKGKPNPKNCEGTIIGINGGYVYVKPHYARWSLELYYYEFVVIGEKLNKDSYETLLWTINDKV